MFLYSLTLVVLLNGHPVAIQQEHNSSLQCETNLKELVAQAQAAPTSTKVLMAKCQKTLQVDR